MNSKNRFSSRVADYVRYRPGYPPEVLQCLQCDFGLGLQNSVADVGSGTGIFTQLLMEQGHTVYAVEPNANMREAAEQQLATNPRFKSINGSAEATTLPNSFVDAYVAAQALHWFDIPRARAEAMRILRPEGLVALIWNNRLEQGPFLEAYESFLHEFAIDYAAIKHQNAEVDGRIPTFFGHNQATRRCFHHAQRCDFESLKGRTLSASYMPSIDHPRFSAMIQTLKSAFDCHNIDGSVAIEYETVMYVGRLSDGTKK
ncbi:MAG: class I SAM-dependent methyltransferase [Planctomycetota bacterium]